MTPVEKERARDNLIREARDKSEESLKKLKSLATKWDSIEKEIKAIFAEIKKLGGKDAKGKK